MWRYNVQPPPVPSDPLLLQELIKSLGEMDIHTEQDCFASWLAAKKQHPTTKPSKKQVQAPKPKVNYYAIESIEELENMTSEEIDALLKRLEQNKSAYQRWLDNKRIQKEKQIEKIEKKKLVAKSKKEQEAKKKDERQVFIRKQISAWQEQKDLEHRKKLEAETKFKLKEKEEKEKRDKMAKKAFDEWRSKHSHKQHADEPPSTSIIKKSRPMWIQEIPKQEDLSDKRGLGSGNKLGPSKTVLSPPNLYNDYKVYKKLCPEYFKKYSLLVASGGHSSSEMDLSNVKKSKKEKVVIK